MRWTLSGSANWNGSSLSNKNGNSQMVALDEGAASLRLPCRKTEVPRQYFVQC